MSLGDIFDFELFNAKDMLGKVKKDPWRLLVGAGDPLSTKAWNKITGKNMEPLVDQMGGAYGGDWISAFGKGQDGGVYGRAKAAGIDTKAGGRAHDVAHVVSAIMAGNYGLGQMGGGAPSASAAPNSNLGIFSNGGKAGLDGLGGGNMGALARSGAVPGGAGMGSATPVTGMNWQDLVMKQGLGGMPGMNTGVPPQQPPPTPPQIQATDRLAGPTAQQIAGPTPPPMQQSLASRAMGGLGRARDALTPIDPRMAEGMDPEHIKQLRNQAMLRLGLGMMSNAHQGGRFGEALAAGLGQAQGAFNKDIEGTYQRGVEARELKRIEDRDQREIAREEKLDSRYDAEFDYRKKLDEIDRDFAEKRFGADERYRRRRLALEEMQMRAGPPQAPSGYRFTANGDLQFIPGGPADPSIGQKPAKPTEYERKARLLFGEMVDAERQYQNEAGEGETSVWNSMLDSNPVTRVFTSEDFRQREAAGMRWAQNFLYLKSGAAATNEEVRKTFVQYMPQPGDTDAVIQQKAQARQQAMENVAEANAIDMPQISEGPAIGSVVDGYRFKGGNPSDPNSWEPL